MPFVFLDPALTARDSVAGTTNRLEGGVDAYEGGFGVRRGWAGRPH